MTSGHPQNIDLGSYSQLLLTSSGGHQNTYGYQAGGKHPTGMLSWSFAEKTFVKQSLVLKILLNLPPPKSRLGVEQTKCKVDYTLHSVCFKGVNQTDVKMSTLPSVCFIPPPPPTSRLGKGD